MSTQPTPEQLLPSAEAPAPEQGIDLLSVAVALLSQWRVALLTFVLTTALCFMYIYSLTPQYEASARFLPQEGRSEGNSLASLFSNRGPGALYIGLLQSQTVQNDVIQRNNLLSLFHTSSMESARNALAGVSKFSEGADTIVTVTVRDTNAGDAARIANAYLAALRNLNETMGLQQSSQTTNFFQKQLDAEREELSTAEMNLSRTQTRTGVISDAQTGNAIAAIQSVRDQITNLEAQRSVLLLSDTEQNPQVQRLAQTIGVLRGKEAQLEGSGSSPQGAATPAGQVPTVNLEIIRAQRAVKYHEILVNSLATQFESARLNEAFARSAFQVVDNAVAPEHKAWPPRKPYLLISLAFAALMGMIAVAVRLTIGRLLSDPEHRDQLRQLRRAFGRK